MLSAFFPPATDIQQILSFNSLQTSATDPPNVLTGISKKQTLTITAAVE